MRHQNDGRFPDDSAVLVRYPLGGPPVRQRSRDRAVAAWHGGAAVRPNEWLVTFEDRRLTELEDGTLAPESTPDEDLLFPRCYRDSSELQPMPEARQVSEREHELRPGAGPSCQGRAAVPAPGRKDRRGDGGVSILISR